MAAALALEHADCVLCGADDPEPVAVGADFDRGASDEAFLMVRCRRCSQLYLNPRPADFEAARFEGQTDMPPADAPLPLAMWLRRRFEAERIAGWCRPLPARARVLEIGCGRGERLAGLRQFGRRPYRLEGVETDRSAANQARARGLIVHAGALETVALDAASYDLAYSIHALERARDPLAFLERVGRLLRPAGRLIVITNNAASVDGKLFGRRHYGGYGFPRHRYVFTRETLAHAAVRSGLRVVTIAPLVSSLTWVRTLRNALLDARAPEALVRRFESGAPETLLPLTLLDALGPRAGRALLCATLEPAA